MEGKMKIARTVTLEEYLTRLDSSIQVFKGHKSALREARQAYKQIMPGSMIDATVGDSTNASAILHPQFRYMVKKFIEDLTSLPVRFEYASNTKEGEVARTEAEAKLRGILGMSHITSRLGKLYNHCVVDGLGVVQSTTDFLSDEIIDPEGKSYPHNQRRIVDLSVYDPIKTYLDPNCDGTDIVGTSAYIIVTIGIYDEFWVGENFPEYLGADTNGKGKDLGKTAWADDGEDEMNELDSGVNRSSQDKYKVREYYTADGFFYTVINDEWISEPSIVVNGISNRIPFNIVATIPDVDNPMGESMFGYLKTPLAMASKALNMIADATEMNVRMPFFTFQGSGLDDINMADLDDSAIYLVKKVQDVKSVHDMFYRPTVPEVTQGASILLNEGSQMMYMLTGTNPTAISGEQTPQIKTNGVAEMLERAGMRSNNAFARKIEQILNGILWDFYRVFFIYYHDFNFPEELVTQEFFVDFDNIRVVPGSYLPEDKLSRLAKAQEVLRLAQLNPDGFELTVVYSDFLKALGVTVPDRVLKSAEENMLEMLAMQIAQTLGPDWQSDESIVSLVQQLAELASTKDGDMA